MWLDLGYGIKGCHGNSILKALFCEIWNSCLICRFNRIVMLGIEYFDSLEHYCFEKYDISDLFQSICDVTHYIMQI